MARTTWGPLSTDEQNQIEFAPVGEPGVLAPGTTGGLLKRNADGTIGNSILSESGSVLTAAGRLVIGGGTVTGSTPVLDLSQTWNNGAVAFQGINFDVTDTASSFSSRLLRIRVGGGEVFGVTKVGTVVASTFQGTSSGSFNFNSDTYLVRGAANTLDLRNSTAAQTWNVYGTADAGLLNYRRIRTTMTTGGAVTIAAEGLGSGVSGNSMAFSADGTTLLTLSTASGIVAGNSITVPSGNRFSHSGRSGISSAASGEILLSNSGVTDADFFLKLGVNTSAAAGIKRVGTELRVRLNDDSAFAALSCAHLTLNDSNVVLGTTTGSKVGTATTQKLGFWNATPIVQPSSTGETAGFTAGAGTPVTDTSTFTGNVGATAYRISDIVKALKNSGLMAS